VELRSGAQNAGMDRLAVYLAIAQGIYFFATGVWPLVHMRSFLAVTGPKVDLWLVKTVGVVIGVIGIVLLLAGERGEISQEVAVLAAGSAAGLGTVNVVYVAKRVIPMVYLLDAAAEAALVVAWLVAGATG